MFSWGVKSAAYNSLVVVVVVARGDGHVTYHASGSMKPARGSRPTAALTTSYVQLNRLTSQPGLDDDVIIE